MKKSKIVLLSALHFGFFAVALAAPPQFTFDAKGQNGTVEFNAVGRPSALKIHGKGGAPSAKLQVDGKTLSGTASFKLETLDTGIKLRNEHMKAKYLEIAKFPEAVLTFQNIALPKDLKSNVVLTDVPFTGTLRLHGVEKPVQGKTSAEKNGKKLKVDAMFDLKISDFNIPTPGFAGITMAEDVSVKVSFEAEAN